MTNGKQRCIMISSMPVMRLRNAEALSAQPIPKHERTMKMKELTKKIIAVSAVLCVALAGVTGCSDTKKNSSSTDTTEEVILQIPFDVGGENDNPMFSEDPNKEDLAAADPTAPANNGSNESSSVEATTEEVEYQPVTDAEGQPVTEYVTVTDAAGQPATDAEGQTVTQAVQVTQAVTKTASGNAAPGGNTETSTPENSSYTGKTEGRYAMWLDISKDENFLFQGDFLHVQFKVKDNVPAGDYSIRINPDIADISGRSVHEYDHQDGTVRINNGTIAAAVPNLTSDDRMLVYGDNVAAKSGDTIDYYINIKNNLGMCAFCIWFYYDGNAMEFLSCEPSGEYSEIAKRTDVGGENSNKPIPEE